MTEILQTTMEIKSWDEQPYRELDDGRKLTKADVVLAGSDGQLESGTFESLMYYAADGTTTYVTVMHLTATLNGRAGSVVLVGEGTFDGTTARGTSRVVDGTGELAGISGELTSESTHADYPNMPITLSYDLE